MAPNPYSEEEEFRQLWNWLTSGGTADPVSTPPSVAIGASGAGTSNVALTKIGTTAVDSNSGVKSAGTLRVVLATDQPALTTAMPVAGADAPADGHATPTTGVITSAYPELFNGTTSDLQRNNTNVIVQASTARTTTQTFADQTNYNARGLHLVVDVTTAGTGSITPKVQGKDANGIYYDILVGTAITTVSTNVLKVFPGLPPTVNAVASDVLPRIWRVIVTANNANSITYSVGAQLVV